MKKNEKAPRATIDTSEVIKIVNEATLSCYGVVGIVDKKMVNHLDAIKKGKKEEAIFEVHTYIDEAKEDIEGFQTAKNFIRFLLNMLDEAEYSEDGLDVNKYLYAGIECGIPTLEEVDSEV